jgi:acetyl esterase/lipase
MHAALVSVALFAAADPTPKSLWHNGAPGAVGDTDKDRPSLTAYRPDPAKAVGTAVVVCPGGGYQNLAMGHEGKDVAEWLTARGVVAFVLQYRLGPRYKHPAPMQDVQRALRTVRAGASEYGVARNRVGVWGFSAGGHLASTAATHFDDGKPDSPDPIERVSCRPDFAILAYPVITMEPGTTHAGSRRNLLGQMPDAKLAELMSNDKQVTVRTPPTFLFHTDEDKAVPPMNSILFYQALKRHNVPAELHIYERGRHGVGLAPNDPVLSTWTDRLEAWLRQRALIARAK